MTALVVVLVSLYRVSEGGRGGQRGEGKEGGIV